MKTRALTMVAAGALLTLGGCASRQDTIERTPALSVANTNTEKVMADCIASELIRVGLPYNRARSDRENLTRFAIEGGDIIEVTENTVAFKRNPNIILPSFGVSEEVISQCTS